MRVAEGLKQVPGSELGFRRRRSTKLHYRGDIFCESDAIVDRLDVHNINADNCGSTWHLFGTHLHPAARGSAQVNDSLCIFEKLIHESKALASFAIKRSNISCWQIITFDSTE
jgi:hypothetical protein